jgi:hypothetical protein
VTVYELQAVVGEEALPPSGEAEALAEVDLPAVVYTLDGKRVDETPYPVRVTRIGHGAVELLAAVDLPSTSPDLKLILDFGDGAPGAGSYVRVSGREPSHGAGPAGARIHGVFTSLAEPDRTRIGRLLGPKPSRQVR